MFKGSKTTSEELQEELVKLNKNVTVLERFSDGTNSRFRVKCNVDGYEWVCSKAQILRNGCAKCARNAKKTNDEFVASVLAINKDIEILSEYKSSKEPILVRCKIDGYRWQTGAWNLLKGNGCPKCCGNLKLHHDDFITRLKAISPNIEILSEYVKSSIKVEAKCLVDGHVWNVTPNKLLGGSGCPKCAGNMRKTHTTFVGEMLEINPDVKIIGEYTTRLSRVEAQCLKCGLQWNPRADDLITGTGCPKCIKWGYSQSKPAQFYVYRFDGFLGFGITNSPKTRHPKHTANFKKSNFDFELLLCENLDGKTAWELERSLKCTLPIVDSGIAGFKTECVLLEHRSMLFSSVEKFLKKLLDK